MDDDNVKSLARLVEGGSLVSYETDSANLAVTFSTATGERLSALFLEQFGFTELGLGSVGKVARVAADKHPLVLSMLAEFGCPPCPLPEHFLYTLLRPCGVPLMLIVAKRHSIMAPGSEGRSSHG